MYANQGRFGLGDPAWLDPSLAGGVFLLSLLIALLFHKIGFRVLLRIAIWTPSDFDVRLVAALKAPITFGIVLLGAYLALSLPLLDLSETPQKAVNTIARVLVVMLGVASVSSMVSTAFSWYITHVGTDAEPSTADRLMPLFRRIAVALVYGLGALVVLDQLNINISPLIAGLGLGGLAVALAIQPTLANLFAGTYVMTEGVIHTDDYIELESGLAGYVVDVGWRSTRIRTWSNNLVVIPNSRFAETIITNYQEPTPEVNVYLVCGVSYDADLAVVERVSYEVMDDVLETEPQAVKEYGCYFGYENFGESNVDFWLFVQAKDRLGSFIVRSTLMQQLHQRFAEENIVINYPVRTLQFPKEWSPRSALQSAASEGPGSLPSSSGARPRGMVRRTRRERETTNPADLPSGDVGSGGGDGPGGPA